MRQKNEYDFVVTLKHPEYKIYNVITVLMCVITIAAEIYGLIKVPFSNFMWVNVCLLAVVIFNLVFSYVSRKEAENIVTFKWSLYAAAFLWLLLPLYIPAIGILFIIAALLERQIK